MSAPILYFTRVVPEYRVGLLEQLDRRLREGVGARLVVASGQPPQRSALPRHRSSPRYEEITVPNYWVRGETLHYQPFQRVFRQYGRPRAVLLEESPRSLSLPLLLAYLRSRRIGSVLWGHFSSNQRAFSARNLSDRYRIWLAHQADACVCYTDSVADLLKPHVAAERLFVARNTLDTDVLFAMRDTLAAEGRVAVRRRLGLAGDHTVLLFIGRLTADKGLDTLLDVFTRIRASRPATLLIIGDGPARAMLEQRIASERVPDVRLVGELLDWHASAPYVFASDVMVMPRHLGLAVNHAFCFGVPVVSQRGPGAIRFHGPEVSYVRSGENGILAAHADPEALHAAVEQVLRDHATFSRNALEYARTRLSREQMLAGLESALRFAERR